MKIKSKILVLSTVGAFALSYAIVGSNAFADTNLAPVPPIPSVTATPTPSPTPSVTPIQAPAGLTSPLVGITQDDDLDDVNEDGIDDAEENEISDDSDDLLDVSITVGDTNQSSDTDNVTGQDD